MPEHFQDGLRVERNRSNPDSARRPAGPRLAPPPARAGNGHERARGGAVPPFFAELADDAIAGRARHWQDPRTQRSYRQLLDDYVLPHLGGLRVDRIDADAIVRVVHPHWQGPGSKGHRILRQIATVMDEALVRAYRDSNPARSARRLMPPVTRRRRQHPSVPHGDVARVLAGIREAGRSGPGRGDDVAALALEMLILSVSRPAAVLAARWDQVDLEHRTWTIPAKRTSNGLPHLVPLSRQAVAVLDRVRRLVGDSGMLFRYRSDGGMRPMPANKLTDFMRKRDLGGTPYGFRASFRAWAVGAGGMPPELARVALGHYGAILREATVQRPTLVEARRPLMQRWADYVAPDGQENAAAAPR